MILNSKSLMQEMAEKAGVSDVDTYYDALIKGPFALCKGISKEEMVGVLIIANSLNLDPFRKEIYAVPGRGKDMPIVPAIGYDGWIKILLRQPTFDGLETVASEEMITPEGFSKPVHAWCECIIYDKKRTHPIKLREYFSEVERNRYFYDKQGNRSIDTYSPWYKMPWRMLRNKTVIQTIRNAYAVGGFEDDEMILEDVLLNDENDESLNPNQAIDSLSSKKSSNSSKTLASSHPENISKPGFPTIREMDKLMSLLDRAVLKVQKRPEESSKIFTWIRNNLDKDTVEFALSYVEGKIRSAAGEPEDTVQTRKANNKEAASASLEKADSSYDNQLADDVDDSYGIDDGMDDDFDLGL